jgi:hypothetical protein
METDRICSRCGQEIPPSPWKFTAGYATNDQGEKICYECCAELDKQYMRDHGKITLYLTDIHRHDDRFRFRLDQVFSTVSGNVSNWPGSLKFPDRNIKIGRHNIAGVRYDVWFVFENYVWHGTRYGDNTEIVHCRKTNRQYP